MDLQWGDERRNAFVENVGLITSKDKSGEANIMSAEWTFQLSYSPARFGVCIGKGKMSEKNISETKVFGISIASEKQTVVANIAGNSHSEEVNKINVLKELGVKFVEGKETGVLLVEGSVLQIECKVVERVETGTHILFIGEAVWMSEKIGKERPLVYNSREFHRLGEKMEKPVEGELERIKSIVDKNKRK